MGMVHAMQALRQFFARHNLPEPEGIEFRFSDELAAHNFDAALKVEFDPIGPSVIDVTNPSRVNEICGFKIQPTFQKFGPPHSVDLLPAYHPARRGERS